MPRSDLPLSQNPYAAAYMSLGSEIVDNFYLEQSQSETAKAPFYMVGVQGLQLERALSLFNSCRGLFTTSSNRTFGAWGGKLFELTNQGTARIQIGILRTTAGPVRFAENGYQLIAVDGRCGYILDLTSNAFGQILDQYFPGIDDPTKGPSHVACVDTYFLVNSTGTNRYYWSAPYYTPYAFDAKRPDVKNLWWGLQYGQKVGDTDQIVGMISNVNLLWVFGQNSMEVHQDTGNSRGQLFQRMDTAFVGFGCLSGDSLCKYGNETFWLGNDRSGTIGMFKVGTDFQPVRISTRGIETRIQRYSQIDDCWAYTYAMDGHAYVVWNFPHGTSVDEGPVNGATWIYDITTGTWTRRTRWEWESATSFRWVGQWATYNKAWGKILLGDGSSDAVYQLSSTKYENDRPNGQGTDMINRIVTSPIEYNHGRNMIYRSVQLNMQQGTGLRNGNGSDPKVMMCASDDGGFTYGYERFAQIGQTGHYKSRTRWLMCGMGRNRVWRFRCTEPVKVVVVGMTVEAEVLSR